MDNNLKPEYTVTTLKGKWCGYGELENKDDYSYRYEAVIYDGIIEIKEISYPYKREITWWLGTYADPEKEVTSYSWESTADHNKMDMGDGASSNFIKTFTYENGIISFLLNDNHEHNIPFNRYIYLEKVEE